MNKNIRKQIQKSAMVLLMAGISSSALGGEQITVSQSDPEMIIPSEGLPAEAIVNTSNNNLDVIEHEGDLYFSWRTSLSHFASDQTLLQVMKKSPGGDWQYEFSLHAGKDLREPRFLSLNGELYLYFAELGTNPIAFEPGRTLYVKRDSNGEWGGTEVLFDNGFIPWRINWVNNRPIMIGYQGGENIYQADQTLLSLIMLTTDDGAQWYPAYGDDGVVLESGVSETDFAISGDYLYAVGRNEAGDEDGWGSKICKAPMSDPSNWHCEIDRRKYDSPLLISSDEGIYLVARRQVFYGGNYDLKWRGFSFDLQSLVYQAFYWLSPKRCSIWRLDKETLSISWLVDIPSAGDTCFPSAIKQGDGSFDIYNYSSDYTQGATWSWIQGQLNDTHIYKVNIKFSEIH